MSNLQVLHLFLPEIREMLSQKDFLGLKRALNWINPVDLAEGWEVFSSEEQAAIFRLLSRRKAAVLFEELEPEQQNTLFQHIRDIDLQELISDLDPSEASRIFRHLPDKVTKHLASLLKHESLQTVERLMTYPPETVGSYMRTRFFLLQPQWTTQEALERLRSSLRLRHLETTFFDTLYVASGEEKLLGQIFLKELVAAPLEMKISELSHQVPVSLRPETDQEEAGGIFSRYKLTSAPVADGEGKILGVLLHSDIYEILEEETEEDFAKMAGVRFKRYWSQTTLGAARLRFPWLVTTCIGQFLVSTIIRYHEDILSQMVALASFMPFIAAMGGNIGTQSATITVRGLATRELLRKPLIPILLKEIRVGMLAGATYGLLLAAIAYAFYGSRFHWKLSGVVAAGMMVSMTVAATMGALAPFLLKRLRFDPAIAAGPLITTTTDLISTLSYFALASWMLFA